MALARVLVIMAGFAVLVAGCDRTDQTGSEASAQAANAQTVYEVPAVADSSEQQGQPADALSDAPLAPMLQKESTEQEAAATEQSDTGDSGAPDAKVIAYYFHRTMRCPTCLSIEKQAREAVEAAYLEELEAGQLEWHAVNIEEEGNEHFESDFELSSSSLVIVEMHGDEVAAWKNLEQVWELVEDPLGFQEYVWNELMEFVPG